MPPHLEFWDQGRRAWLLLYNIDTRWFNTNILGRRAWLLLYNIDTSWFNTNIFSLIIFFFYFRYASSSSLWPLHSTLTRATISWRRRLLLQSKAVSLFIFCSHHILKLDWLLECPNICWVCHETTQVLSKKGQLFSKGKFAVFNFSKNEPKN